MSISDFLQGRRVLEERDSEFNGKLTVIQDLIFGTYIMGGGLPQSGGLAEDIWKTTFKEIPNNNNQETNILILGLGGGGIIKAIQKKFPKAKITGVDIDPVIVELGQKYFGWDKEQTKVIIDDVEKFVNKFPSPAWDYILLDTYQGENFPEKFESEDFLRKLKKMLSKDGMLIANRLYGEEDMKAAKEFGKTLGKVFSKIDRVFPEANIMFMCK